MNLINLKIVIGFLAITATGLASATEFEIPNEFQDGQVTSASDMNANFLAMKAAIDILNTQMATAQSESPVVFQGFSAETFDGAAGLMAMQQACHNLSAGSHICTDSEIAKSPYNPDAVNLDGDAWVLRESGALSASNWDYIFDSSPLSLTPTWFNNTSTFLRGFSCVGWASLNAQGATVNSNLQFSSHSCDNLTKVA